MVILDLNEDMILVFTLHNVTMPIIITREKQVISALTLLR